MSARPPEEERVAVIGMAGRFPKARNLEEFWRNVRDGIECVSFFSEDELRQSGVDGEALRDPRHVRAGAVLDDIDRFDAGFFEISPRQAELTDPQHRLFLECVWEALESAGCDPATYPGSIGVYAGSLLSNYLVTNIYPVLGYAGTIGNLQTLIGNDKDYLATHVSYRLNLRGPSITVQSACSTSLVAIHLASQALLSGEIDMALAGGVAVRVPQKTGYPYIEGAIFSPDGHCRPFDAQARGTIFGNGLGVVVLKRLSDALQGGDRIDAVILGSAVNNDGSLKAGYTAPSEDGQAEVIAEALAVADVPPDSIGYVEAHGTGTPIGDPIEIAALKRAFRTEARGFCALGAVKSNIGHLESAAGAAGFIKTVLALKHKELPPTVHFRELNPQIDLTDSPFYVSAQRADWRANGTPRRAGVSSFGIGGTNAHVVLEEAPTVAAPPERAGAHLLPLSAKTPAALRDLARAYAGFLADDGGGARLAVRDIAYTASSRRRHHRCRHAVVGCTRQELAERLETALAEGQLEPSASGAPRESARRVAFVFSGQGAQWAGMGRQLAAEEPLFRQVLEECAAAFRRAGAVTWSLCDELAAEEDRSRLGQTELAQPALFAVQVALTALWRSWGIVPSAVVGHSVGEVAAAHVAGVLSLDDAARVVVQRGRLMQRATGQGRMLSVGLAAGELEEMVRAQGQRLSVAAVNSPTSTVLAGDPEAIAEAERTLDARHVAHRPLPVNYAFHSAQMEPFRAEMAQAVRGLQPRAATVPVFSTVTGRRADPSDYDAAYWARNIRQPVLFGPAVQQLLKGGHDVLVEVGPHPALRSALEECVSQWAVGATVLGSLRRKGDGRTALLESLGRLYSLGQAVTWSALHPDGGACVSLPSYPWQRQRYWLQPPGGIRLAAGGQDRDAVASVHPLLGRRLTSALREIQFETRVGTTTAPYLADHRVAGRTLFPVSAYLEIGRAAAAIAWPEGTPSLEDVRLHEPLSLENEPEPPLLQVILRPEALGRGTFEVFSRRGGEEGWHLHASGKVSGQAADVASAPDASLAVARGRCTEEASGEAYYERLRQNGFEYGPAYRGIETLWRGRGEALAAVRLPQGLEAPNDAYPIHPALLDACLQVFAAAFASEGDTDLYVPVEARSFHVRGTVERAVWSYAVLRDDTGTGAAPTGDVFIFDQDERLVAWVTGFSVRRVDRASIERSKRDPVRDWFYELQWQAKARSAESRTASAARRWLILADRGGVGSRLAAGLAGRQLNVTQVETGGADEVERLRRLLANGGEPYDGVVHLGSLDAPTAEDAAARSLGIGALSACSSVLHLVQTLARSTRGTAPRLAIVTRGSQAVAGTAVALGQAPVWGLARVIALEHPDLRCRRLDLDPRRESGEIDPVLDEILGDDPDDQVAFREGQRYVPRLVRARSFDAARPTVQATDQPRELRIATRGVLENLTLEPAVRRAPGTGEVEIEVAAAGLNFRDVLNALGLYPGDAGPLGLECAGRVTAVGDGVAEWRAGDEVVAFAPAAFGTYAVTRADCLARKPAGSSFEEAATLPLAFMTAFHALEDLARVKAGDRVLVHAAAGGVGLAAVQLAQRAGAEVWATAGSVEKRRYLEGLGVAHVMSSRTLDFAAEVMERTAGRGVDVVLNSLSGDFIPKSLSVLAAGGRFVEIGKIGAWEPSQVQAARPDVSYFRFDLAEEAAKDPVRFAEAFRSLVARFERAELKPIPCQTFPMADAVGAFRTMAQARHIGKIVLRQESGSREAAPHLVRSDGTYLVTGGLGALGLRVAAWLVEQGARYLVLVGRRPAGEAASEAIRRLTELGAHVSVEQADVSQDAEVTALLARLEPAMPPLRGIVHAAGVLDDGPLVHQNAERLAAVLAPKLDGACNLHRGTLGSPLDFFVLFSSTAALLGSPGQGSYAAANAFLDALAHYRRQRGLVATSIDWSGWAESGMAVRDKARERMALLGMEPIAPDLGLEALGRVLRQGPPQIAVMPVDWRKLREKLPEIGQAPVFTDVLQGLDGSGQDEPASRGTPDLLRRLEQAPRDDRRHVLTSFLVEQARKVLGLAPSVPLDPRQPLNELGLDSLMAIEVRNGLGLALGRSLPATVLFDHPTIESLSVYLADDVLKLEATESAPTTSDAELTRHEEAASVAPVASGEALSEDELETLLRKEVAAVEPLLERSSR